MWARQPPFSLGNVLPEQDGVVRPRWIPVLDDGFLIFFGFEHQSFQRRLLEGLADGIDPERVSPRGCQIDDSLKACLAGFPGIGYARHLGDFAGGKIQRRSVDGALGPA